jgi:hypothetical protein
MGQIGMLIFDNIFWVVRRIAPVEAVLTRQ